MAAQIPIWNGPTSLSEHPDSPHFVTDSTKTAVTRIYEGIYAAALAGEPAMGAVFSDLPGDVIVVGTDVQHMPGGKGRLTINFETAYATTFEVEWVEVDKALIMHPRYWSVDAGFLDDGPEPLTIQDRAMIEKWEAEDDAAYKLVFKFKVLQATDVTGIGTATPDQTGISIPGYAGQFNIYVLSSPAQDYATKRLKGIEAYRLWAPVVRQTSEFLYAPDVEACGLLQNPPEEANAPDGYVWQLSAERSTRTGPYGKYRLQIEWQGADEIDTDLYQEASPSTAPDPPT